MPDSSDSATRATAARLTVMQAHSAADCPDRSTCWASDIHDTHQPEEPMTITERTSVTAAVEGDLDRVERSLDHVKRVTIDTAMRAHNAIVSGATLAYTVERFLADPDGIGTNALHEAWSLFMARHAGNFTDSAMAVR